MKIVTGYFENLNAKITAFQTALEHIDLEESLKQSVKSSFSKLLTLV